MLVQQNALMDDGGGRDLGSCFHFIPDKVFGRMENASPITALALEVGDRQSGCSRLTQMQNHPELIKPLCHKGLICTWQALAPEHEFALAFCRDDTFPFHRCLLAFVV